MNQYARKAFSTVSFITLVGWYIFPVGYFFGYRQGAVDDSILYVVYVLADFVNKIAFCLATFSSSSSRVGFHPRRGVQG